MKQESGHNGVRAKSFWEISSANKTFLHLANQQNEIKLHGHYFAEETSNGIFYTIYLFQIEIRF